VKYAVGIPTRGRTDVLYGVVAKLLDQSIPPDLILIIDNNDTPKDLEQGMGASLNWAINHKRSLVEFVSCDYPTKGIAHGDQTALRVFTERGFKVAARWDDDLMPDGKLFTSRTDCMKTLLGMMDKYPAAGGMYPPTNDISLRMGWGFSHMQDGKPVGADGDPRHLQFWRWHNDEERVFERPYLYSSFVYDVAAANDCGGFCTEYSAHSFRADTDFTLRLSHSTGKPLAVNTTAIAEHMWCSGGTRDIIGKEKERMQTHDIILFGNRMKGLGINHAY